MNSEGSFLILSDREFSISLIEERGWLSGWPRRLKGGKNDKSKKQ